MTTMNEPAGIVEEMAVTADAASGDLFADLNRLRIKPEFASEIGAKKVLISIPVRRPDRQAFFRVHPDLDYAIDTAVLEWREERETFLVEPGLWSQFPGELIYKRLYTAITRQGVPFLWPIRLPGPDGRIDSWNRVALEAAEKAKASWLRIAANMAVHEYEVFEAMGRMPDPEWPDLPFNQIMAIAFRDKIIDNLDHPAVQRLLGA